MTAHRKCAVRRRHRDVASANTLSNLHNVLSLVTFFTRAKKVTRSPQASESSGSSRIEIARITIRCEGPSRCPLTPTLSPAGGGEGAEAKNWIPPFAGMTSQAAMTSQEKEQKKTDAEAPVFLPVKLVSINRPRQRSPSPPYAHPHANGRELQTHPCDGSDLHPSPLRSSAAACRRH